MMWENYKGQTARRRGRLIKKWETDRLEDSVFSVDAVGKIVSNPQET